MLLTIHTASVKSAQTAEPWSLYTPLFYISSSTVPTGMQSISETTDSGRMKSL